MEEAKTKETTDLQIIQSKLSAEFSLTPIGQMVKQFEVTQRMAKMYSESTIVPEIYKGNIGNCAIALDIAVRMKLNPLMVMQSLDIIKGKPSFSSKFLIATVNISGRFTSLKFKKKNLGKVGIIKYKENVWDNVAKKNKQVIKDYDGSNLDNIECIAYAKDVKTDEVLESDPVSISLAIQEGWYTKDGSKWATMPQLMLSYRAAAFWARVYCPEISMGFLTREEVEDVEDVEYVEIKDAKSKLSDLAKEAAGLSQYFNKNEEKTTTDSSEKSSGEKLLL